MAERMWDVTKINPQIQVGVNTGVVQVLASLGAELQRVGNGEQVGRLGEIDFASRVGPSPLNLGTSLEVVRRLHGLDLVKVMHMDPISLIRVKETVENVTVNTGIILAPGEMQAVPLSMGALLNCLGRFGARTSRDDELHNNNAIAVSLFLCISHTIGEQSAVRCLKRFLMNRAEESSSGSRPDGAWLESYLELFRKSIYQAGHIVHFQDVVDSYNKKYYNGPIPWEGYSKPVEKIVGKLLEELALPSDDIDESVPSEWWTRSRKVHKLAYLLCYMGWYVRVEDLPEPRKTKLIVKFTSAAVVKGNLIEDKLNSAGAGAPTRIFPSAEDEQGPGVSLPSESGLVHAVRAVLEKDQNVDGRAIEHAWYLGYKIGEKYEVELVFGETECSYRFGESTLKPSAGDSWPGIEDILYEIDKPLKKYAPMLNEVLASKSGMECKILCDQLKNIFKIRDAKLFNDMDRSEVADVGSKFRALVAFYFGLVYGKLKALLVATGLKDPSGNWAADCAPLEFRVGWMDFMGQFLHDVQAKMWDLSNINSASPRMHSVFSFIGMCCSSKSIYFGRQVQKEDIVGFWTGTSLVILAAAMNPGVDPQRGAKLKSYGEWLLNLSTVDGVHLQSSKWIKGEVRQQNLWTADAQTPFPKFEKLSRETKLNIYLSPNYVEENAQLVHSMMCNGDIVCVAPVMAALVNLHKKLIKCSSGERSGTCDGTDERRRSCPGGMPIFVSEFLLGYRSYHESEGVERPKVVGVIMARDDESWRFAASCIYHDRPFVVATSCLSCASEGKVSIRGEETWGEYII